MLTSSELTFVALQSLADHGLVFCRLLGLLCLLPGISTPALSWHLRAILLITLAGVITPNVSVHAQSLLSPQTIQHVSFEQSSSPDFDTLQADASFANQNRSQQLAPPRSLVAWIHLAFAEVCLGLLLGVGANLVLQSFRMAGSLVDQQVGLSNAMLQLPEGENEGAGTGELFFWLGGALFLIAGGHLLFISTLLDTFHQFPIAYGEIDCAWCEVVTRLVHQSLKLALQLAAPIIATQLLVSIILNHAGNTAPQFNTFGVSVPVRIVSACLVLSLTLTGFTDRILEAIPQMLSASVTDEGVS